MLPQNALDRAASDRVAEVLQCAFHPRVSPALVFTHHLEHQLDDLLGFPWPPGSTVLASIVLVRHLFPIPSQDGIGRSERGHLGQQLAAQFHAKNREASSIGVREIQFPVPKLLLEDAVLGHQVVNLLLQRALEPDGQPRCQELQRHRQHRTERLGLLPAHGLPFTPFRADGKSIRPFSNL